MINPKITLSLFAIALIIIVIIVAYREPELGPSTATDVESQQPSAELPSAGPSAPGVANDHDNRSESTTRYEAAAENELPSEATTLMLRSRIYGRVVDPRGVPLQAIQISLTSQGPWVDDSIPERATPEEVPARYEGSTDSSGLFSFDVRTPTSDWVSLSVRGGPHRSISGRIFGPAGGRDLPRIRPGENDLGSFTLSEAGAIWGTITDSRGVPIEAVSVRLEDDYPGGHVLAVNTDQNGRYELGCLVPGTVSVATDKEGYLQQLVSDLQVDVGRTRGPIDLKLIDAPFIAGYVRNESGEPIANARLTGWPQYGGTGADGRTDRTGAFRISLPENKNYALDVDHPDYDKIDDQGPFAPGDDRIELVMSRRSVNSFIVLDQVTGEPILRYGLKLIKVRDDTSVYQSSHHDDPPPIKDHEGGRCELAGIPRYCDYVIDAPGYGSRRDRVILDDEATQVIRLDKEAVILGRLIADGTPVASPRVRLERDTLTPPPNKAPDPENPDEEAEEVFDLDPYSGRVRSIVGDVDGRFHFSGLASGTYRVTTSAPEAAPLTIDRVKLGPGERRDLGDIIAVPPGSIRGQVILPSGTQGGVFIGLGEDFDQEAETDVDGQFAFEGLAPGRHILFVDEQHGVVVPGPPFSFDLAPGEHKQVTLNLTDRVPARVRARVTIGGSPAIGIQVAAKTPPVDLEEGNERSAVHPVGFTDEAGWATGWIPPGDNVRFLAQSRQGIPLINEPTTRRVVPGETVNLELSGQVGSMRVRLPEGIAIPANPPPTYLFIMDESGRGSFAPFTPDWVWEDQRATLEIPQIAPGEYRIEYHIYDEGHFVTTASVVQDRSVDALLSPSKQ